MHSKWADAAHRSIVLQVDGAHEIAGLGRDESLRFDLGIANTGGHIGLDPSAGLSADFTVTQTFSTSTLRKVSDGTVDPLKIALRGPIAPMIASTECGFKCSQSLSWAGEMTVGPDCIDSVQTGAGYAQLTAAMKTALTKLYARLDRVKACYRFQVGYRDQAYQDRLRKRWHDIADQQGRGDRRTEAQV